MEDSKERLIEAAVRPFSDNAEMKLAAVRLLGELVNADAPGAEEAIERWDAVDGKKQKPLWRIGLYCVLAIISAVIVTVAAETVINHESVFGSSTDIFYGYPKVTDEEVSRNLTAEQKLLLFGDSSKSSKTEKMKGLWDSAPANLAYFAEYAEAYLSEHKDLPPDFLETARRIDPQNAWFTYVAAGVKAKDAVKKRLQSETAIAANETPEWDILNEVKFNESLALFREARDQPKCENYMIRLSQQRIQLLPRKKPAEVTYSIGHMFETAADGEYSLGALTEVVSAKGWLVGERNDPDGFSKLLLDTHAFLQKRTDTEVGSLVCELVTRIIAFGSITNLAPTAGKLGFKEESARLSVILERIHKMKALQRSRKTHPGSKLLYRNGSETAWVLIGPSSTQNLENPPLLTEEELKPGRLTDHEIYSGIFANFAWAALIVSLGVVAAYRFRSPTLVRRLAWRIESLMKPSDWGWLLGLGIGLPFLYFAVITRLTPLGGRGLSIGYNLVDLPYIDVRGALLPELQFIGFFVLLVLLPVVIARWRLGKRTAFLYLPGRRFWLDWLMAFSAAVSISLIGWSVIDTQEPAKTTALVMEAIPVLWLLMVSFRALCGTPGRLLHSSVVARMVVAAYALAALLMISTVPFFKAAAYRWFEQDQLIKPDPAFPAWTTFDYKVAAQMRKELRETLGYDR